MARCRYVTLRHAAAAYVVTICDMFMLMLAPMLYADMPHDSHMLIRARGAAAPPPLISRFTFSASARGAIWR